MNSNFCNAFQIFQVATEGLSLASSHGLKLKPFSQLMFQATNGSLKMTI